MIKIFPPTLETERIILRPLTMDDKPEIFKWTSDPRVSKFMLYTTYKSPDDANFWLENIYTTNGQLDYGFVLKETGQLIGSGGLNYHSEDDSWALGYNLRYDMWGKGFATEISKKIIEYARANYSGKIITGTFTIENTASKRVLEKLGMKFYKDFEYSKFDGSESFKAQIYAMEF